MSIPPPDTLLAHADQIDAERARRLRDELSARPDATGLAIGVLLATAFPPLTPTRDWQHEALAAIARDGWGTERTRAALLDRVRAEVGSELEHARVRRAVRRVAWAEKARIALRELLPERHGGADVDVTAAELSVLADATVELALHEATAHYAQRWGAPLSSSGSSSGVVVLGLGKLGGSELNAGSDIDISFIYDSDDGAAGERSLHDFWTRVARRTVATIEDLTEDGSVWRVDLRLRPEGASGALVNSVAAAERYYETWGRLWERAALLRARPMAGSEALGAQLVRELITPFVFRRTVDPMIATALAELVERSRDELSDAPERDLKLGPGGIREAEFFTQSLQLIWGGREPSLRVPGSLAALQRLRSRGLVSDGEAKAIAQAYVLLRRVEHRVQWITGIQTHLLPLPGPELEHLARTLGYPGADALTAELDDARSVVRELFLSLAPEAPRPPSPYAPVLGALDARDRERLEEACERVFRTAEIAEHLLALAQRPDGLLGELTAERRPGLPDRILDAIGASADPEQAARYLRSFFARFGDPSGYVRLLADTERAPRRFVGVLGASSFVADALVARPDLATLCLSDESVPSESSVGATVAAELDTYERVGRHLPDVAERREAFCGALRLAKMRATVSTVVADLSGELSTRRTTRVLSALADEVLRRAVLFESNDDPSGLAVIAVGKLGGRDIGYGSDLDVIFIYDHAAAPEGSYAPEHFTRLAQRIIRVISSPHPAGPGYELDARLRPSGTQGLLVTSVRAFARYHGVAELTPDSDPPPAVLSSGAAWERQALLRARACAGDVELGARVVAIAARAAYEAGAPPAREMHELRLRMQRELAAEREGRWDGKTGRGGLLDVEFATQWLQMRHGTDERVRTTDTLLALERLRERGYLSRPHYDAFRDGYRFLRRLAQRMHVLRGTGSTVIERGRSGLTELARRMGSRPGAAGSAGESLVLRYLHVTDSVRRAYLEVLDVDE